MPDDTDHYGTSAARSTTPQPLGSRTRALLTYWKERPLRKTDLSFERAVRSMDSAEALVEFKQQSPARWTLYVAGTDTVAVLSHPVIFAAADDYATGNLVPLGQPLPPGMMEDKVERFPSLKCSYTFAFDTSQDCSLYEIQKLLEAHVPTIDGWNNDIPRRKWQSGSDPQYTQRFRMRAPMFVLRDKRGPLPDVPEGTHPWLVAGLKGRPWFAINPATPKLFALEEGKIVDLGKCTPNVFIKGDVLVANFVLSIVSTEKGGWGPELSPVELVRVSTGDPRNWVNPADYAIPVVDVGVRPSLAEGEEFEVFKDNDSETGGELADAASAEGDATPGFSLEPADSESLYGTPPSDALTYIEGASQRSSSVPTHPGPQEGRAPVVDEEGGSETESPDRGDDRESFADFDMVAEYQNVESASTSTLSGEHVDTGHLSEEREHVDGVQGMRKRKDRTDEEVADNRRPRRGVTKKARK